MTDVDATYDRVAAVVRERFGSISPRDEQALRAALVDPSTACEKHPTMGGIEIRLRRADGTAMRGFRIVACGECRARMTREGYTVIPTTTPRS